MTNQSDVAIGKTHATSENSHRGGSRRNCAQVDSVSDECHTDFIGLRELSLVEGVIHE